MLSPASRSEPFRPPRSPRELPPSLDEFLRAQHLACVTQATDRGTVLVFKAPARETDSLRGPLPVEVLHELHETPSAPIIRMVTRFHDDPARPLAFENFVNV